MAYSPGFGSSKPSSFALLGEELVRDLHQDAGAVADARVGADRAAMLQIAAGCVSASSTILCDLRPLMSAMNPTPQESLSSAGSYRPCGSGVPGSAVEPSNGAASRERVAVRRSTNPARLLSLLISSCPAGEAHHLRRTRLLRCAAQERRGQRATDLEKGSLARPSPPWLLPLGATDVSPSLKAGTVPPLLGQQCCPNRPCQILPRHTRLVYAGFTRTFRFVAAALPDQARRGPRAAAWRNAVAPHMLGQIARRVNRLTVVRGKSCVRRPFGYGAEKYDGEAP